MAKKKLNNSLIVTTIIERDQHDRLRELAFYDRATMAGLVRDALDMYIKSRTRKKASRNSRSALAH